MTGTTAGLHEVTLANLPTDALLASLRHLEDLTHELRVIHAGGRSGAIEISPELGVTIQEILDAYQVPHGQVWQAALEASQAGRARLDLTLQLPPAATEASRRLLELLEQADELCRQGTLMTMPSTPAIVELRRWTCAELERQIVDRVEPLPHP